MVERLRVVFACVRPAEPFPAASFKGAVFALGGSTETAEGILSVYAPHLGRPLGRLPAADPGSFWGLERPIYKVVSPIEALVVDILATEGQDQEQEGSVRVAASDVLSRIYTLRPPNHFAYHNGLELVRLGLSDDGEVHRRRVFEHRTAANLKRALALLG
ncbi:hypothetical protein KBZ04_07120 [Cyanobium sp. N5-Cardenillas]|nr:hypothetical protein [Cyanobium sp. N5-Cardenillas]